MNILKYILISFAAIFIVGTGCVGCSKTHKDVPSEQAEQVSVYRFNYEEGPTIAYKGEDVQHQRTVDHARVVTWAGISPGETISKQQPYVLKDKGDSGVVVDANGVRRGKDKGFDISSGGGDWTWWDSVKGFFARIWGWILGIAIFMLILFGLSFLSGSTGVLGTIGSIASGIFKFFLGIFTAGFSWLQALIASWQKKKEVAAVAKPLEVTVTNVDKAKNMIELLQVDADGFILKQTPQNIIDIINASLTSDQATTDAVRAYRIR